MLLLPEHKKPVLISDLCLLILLTQEWSVLSSPVMERPLKTGLPFWTVALRLHVWTGGAWETTLALRFLAHFQRQMIMTASIRLTQIGFKPLLKWLTDYSNKSTDWWTVIRREPWEEEARLSDLMCHLSLVYDSSLLVIMNISWSNLGPGYQDNFKRSSEIIEIGMPLNNDECCGSFSFFFFFLFDHWTIVSCVKPIKKNNALKETLVVISRKTAQK